MFWGVGALVVALMVLARDTATVLLLTFAGVLFGSWLRGIAEWLARRARLRVGWSLAICLTVLLACFVGAGFWIVPRIAEQVPQLSKALVQGTHDLRDWLHGSALGKQLLDEAGRASDWLGHHVSLAVGVVTGLTGAIATIAYVAFVAVYYAASPHSYRRGAIALAPPAYRGRANALCDTLGTMLRRWLWARVIAMTVLGIATAIGLAALGIPLASTLGLLAGLLMFVPYLGAIAGAIPALVTAATVDPAHILYVAILYLAIHSVDGYLLGPMLQKRAVHAPPVLVLASQLVFGALWGIVGFTLATPLIAALVIVVGQLHVEPAARR